MTRPTSSALTQGVRVIAEARYVEDRSRPDEGQWFFAYAITVINEGDELVQLLDRHWVITDADGRVEEVQGPGVIGEQPELRGGETFKYTSACPLPTQFGTMQGSFTMVTEAGERFRAEVAPFTLSLPYAIN